MRLYQRPGSPFWWYDFTIGGCRYRGSTGETGSRAAKIEAANLLAKAKRNGGRSKSWTVSQILGTWYDEHAQHTLSADAIWSNVQNLERCLDCTLPIDRLDNDALIKFRARRRGEGVQPATINRDLAYLQAAIRFCDDMHGQAAPKIHWSRLKYKEPEPRIRYAAQTEFADLVAKADADMADLILAAVITGLRRGNMRWKWHMVDLPGRTITIKRSKGRKPMPVRISAPLAEMLERRRTAAIAKAMADGTAAQLGDADVFDWRNFRKRWEAVRKAAGMVDFRWHDLRHTFGTWARQRGVDLPAIKDAMMHSDIKTTMRYAHIEPEETATVFDKVAGKLAQSSTSNKRKAKVQK